MPLTASVGNALQIGNPMMAKRKNIRGAGRKPQGEFSQLTSPFTLRMSEDLRKQLEAAAEKSGRSASQELLTRLSQSFGRDRDKGRDPAMRALCFVIAEIAHQVVGTHTFNQETKTETPLFNWRSNLFFYRAFKLAVGRILDALEPKGELNSPKISMSLGPTAEGQAAGVTQATADSFVHRYMQSFSSPEARAEYAANYILQSLATKDRESEMRRLEAIGIPSFLREFYGMSDAASDLSANLSISSDEEFFLMSATRPKS